MLTRRRIIALTCLTLLWPFSQLAIFIISFGGEFAPDVQGSVVFLPAGFLTGLFLLWHYAKATSSIERKCIFGGYIFALPVALYASLLSGLILQPLLGATIFGLIPIMIGVWIGRGLGRRLS